MTEGGLEWLGIVGSLLFIIGYKVGHSVGARRERWVADKLLATVKGMLEKEEYEAASRMIRYNVWKRENR